MSKRCRQALRARWLGTRNGSALWDAFSGPRSVNLTGAIRNRARDHRFLAVHSAAVRRDLPDCQRVQNATMAARVTLRHFALRAPAAHPAFRSLPAAFAGSTRRRVSLSALTASRLASLSGRAEGWRDWAPEEARALERREWAARTQRVPAASRASGDQGLPGWSSRSAAMPEIIPV